MSKSVTADSDGVYVEKLKGEEDLYDRMNNLEPPVSPQEEKKLLRKIDLRLPPFLFILYMFTWLDRGALGMSLLCPIHQPNSNAKSQADWLCRQRGAHGHPGGLEL